MRLTGKRLELTLNLIKRMKDDGEKRVILCYQQDPDTLLTAIKY